MNIIIICDQTDCKHYKGGWTGNNHCYEGRCHEPNGVIISTAKGCQTKELSEQALNILRYKDISIKELDFSIRAINSLQAINIKTIGDLVNKTRHQISRIPNIGKRTLWEIDELLEEKGLSLRI